MGKQQMTVQATAFPLLQTDRPWPLEHLKMTAMDPLPDMYASFPINGASWNQVGQDIDGEAVEDYSGWSVSSSDGQTVAIGAFENDSNGTDAGHVRIFSYNGASWNQVGQDIDGEAAEDRSGISVSLSSDGHRGHWGFENYSK